MRVVAMSVVRYGYSEMPTTHRDYNCDGVVVKIARTWVCNASGTWIDLSDLSCAPCRRRVDTCSKSRHRHGTVAYD